MVDTKKYCFRTELHAHTNPVSQCADLSPKEVVETYALLGYDSIVISNHFYPGMEHVKDKRKCISEYIKGYDETVSEGKKAGINVLLGCELRFTENDNDYLIYGIDKDFFDFAYESLNKGLKTFSEKFRSSSTLIIQAHPYRLPSTPAPAELIDGVEVFNLHPGHNSRIGLAAKYAKENNLIVTAGTDFHHAGHQGMTALMTQKPMKTSADVEKVLRSGDYLIEIGGTRVLPMV